MIVRRDVFRASKAMQKKVFDTENIEVLWNCNTREVLGDGFSVTGARLERKDGKEYGGRGEQNAEDALVAAKRELLEETGYESNEWSHLLTVPSNATMGDNYAHLYLAKNCRKVSGQNLDDTEFLNVEKLSAQKIEKLIAQGEFEQVVHVAAWLLALRKMA